MIFQEQITADLAVFFNTTEFAETVIYTPQGGAGVAIPAIVEYEENPDRGTESQATIGKITIKTSDIASPVYRDTVLINGNLWVVMGSLDGDQYTWTLRISRDERPVW